MLVMQGLINFLINTATQISGVTNMVGALIMAIVAVSLWVWSWHRRMCAEGKPGVEPAHLVLSGLIGAAFCLAVAAIGTWWSLEKGSGISPPLKAERHISDEERQRLLNELKPEAHEFKLIHDYGVSLFAVDTESLQYADEFVPIFRSAGIPVRNLPSLIALRRTDLKGVMIAAPSGNNLEMGPARALALAFRRARIEIKLREIEFPPALGADYSLYALVIGPQE
jgi:hypothetical protein